MPGIIGGNDDQRARHAGVGGGEQRVGGHVQAHVLHGAHRPRAAEGRADGHFQRHLLVGRPLGMAAEFGEGLEDFGRRRAGVTRAQGDAGVPGRQRDGFVAA